LKNKYLIISHRFKFRSKSTSVEYFSSLLDPKFHDYNGKLLKLPYRVLIFFKNFSPGKIYGSWNNPYTTFSVGEELWGFFRLLYNFNNYNIIFFPYADFNYFYFSYIKYFTTKKTVLYSYFNVDELENRFKNLNHFKRANVILVTCDEVKDYLQNKFTDLNSPKIVLFPLGVNTNYFIPSNGYKAPQKTILVSGANRRDLDLILELVNYFSLKHPFVSFKLVGLKILKKELLNMNNVTCYDYLNDDEFILPYINSHIAILPLLSAASSNSLNEYISCCLPFVYTDLPGMSELDLSLFGFPVQLGDNSSFISATEKLLFDVKSQEVFRNNCFKHREFLSWDKKALELDLEIIK
jgi:glycosyltransferase involved in cell wall biosynthesis